MKNCLCSAIGILVSLIFLISCEKVPFAEKDILYTDIIPDDTLEYYWVPWDQDPDYNTGYFEISIDPDQDGEPDLKIYGQTWPDRFDHHSYMWDYSYKTVIKALHENAFIGTKDQSQGSESLALGHGDKVNDKLDWLETASIVDRDAQWGHYDIWAEGYLAFKLKKGNDNLYGWVDLDGDREPVIKDYAINLTPNSKITAGQTD